MARKIAPIPIVSDQTLRVMQNVGRKTDAEYGRAGRKYLNPVEVEALLRAAKDGRHGRRDALMIALAYHHALRCSELIHLTWDRIDLKAGTIVIARKKNGIGGIQHLATSDLRALRILKSKSEGDRHVFLSERGGPLTRDAFAKNLAAIGKRAGVEDRLCHPHAIRHAAGHHLANSGKVNAYQLQAVMGHKDQRSTTIYVQGVAGLIKGLWD